MRVDKQWRLCFTWSDSGIKEIELNDYH
ncbi:MAG: hypothetical protein Q4B69_05655 [Slackia sp.]|nr:hypothetical protein [Slackia sp.]